MPTANEEPSGTDWSALASGSDLDQMNDAELRLLILNQQGLIRELQHSVMTLRDFAIGSAAEVGSARLLQMQQANQLDQVLRSRTWRTAIALRQPARTATRAAKQAARRLGI